MGQLVVAGPSGADPAASLVDAVELAGVAAGRAAAAVAAAAARSAAQEEAVPCAAGVPARAPGWPLVVADNPAPAEAEPVVAANTGQGPARVAAD